MRYLREQNGLLGPAYIIGGRPFTPGLFYSAAVTVITGAAGAFISSV